MVRTVHLRSTFGNRGKKGNAQPRDPACPESAHFLATFRLWIPTYDERSRIDDTSSRTQTRTNWFAEPSQGTHLTVCTVQRTERSFQPFPRPLLSSYFFFFGLRQICSNVLSDQLQNFNCAPAIALLARINCQQTWLASTVDNN